MILRLKMWQNAPRYLMHGVRRNLHKDGQTFCEEMIGPSHSVSNLRPVKFGRKHNETKYEVKLRLLRQETQNLNQEWVYRLIAFKGILKIKR